MFCTGICLLGGELLLTKVDIALWALGFILLFLKDYYVADHFLGQYLFKITDILRFKA